MTPKNGAVRRIKPVNGHKASRLAGCKTNIQQMLITVTAIIIPTLAVMMKREKGEVLFLEEPKTSPCLSLLLSWAGTRPKSQFPTERVVPTHTRGKSWHKLGQGSSSFPDQEG